MSTCFYVIYNVDIMKESLFLDHDLSNFHGNIVKVDTFGLYY